ncbi:MAG: arabinosyltransferase, partial [Actinomycetota bacterium]|nr:arabinosyltransferase [Actinomycetota bacterium]
RVWRGRDPGGQDAGGGGPPPAAPRPGPVDAVLVGVSVVWVLLSPVNFDDSWYLLMARGAASSGAVGNAVYMFNAAENPFVASQYLMQLWGEFGQFFSGGWGLVWMRLLPLAFGLLTWVLLRRLLTSVLVDPVLGRERGSGVAPWALLVAYLLWWLPYGMTLRPEPLIVLFAAAVLLLAELARRRRSVGALAGATTCAALAVAVSPSGLVAAAPLVLAVPWLWSWLRVQGRPERVAAVLVLAAAATALVPVGFADATLGNVLESTAVRQWYYLTFSWYEEIVHYQTVLTLPDSSQWARRAPVVLTVALLAVVAVGSGRQTTDDQLRRLLLSSAVASAIALGLLSLTPTKFVNHFGAAAAAPTVLLTAALLRAPLPRQVGAVASVGGAVLLVGAVSLSYAGPNLWRPYSDRGQPFGNHLLANGTPAQLAELAPRLDTLYLRNPLIWITLALLATSWVWWRRRHGRTSALTPDRAVLVLGSTSMVLLTLVVFAAAPVRQYPGWTVALSTVNAVRGEPCGLASHVRVLVDAEQQPGTPVGPAEVTGGFAAATTRPSPAPPPVPDTQVWHGSAPDGPETGAVTTPWYPLPAGADATHLVVPLLGVELSQQRVELEYAPRPGGPAVGALEIEPDPGVAADDWQEVPVALERLGALRPASVRVVAEDRATAPGAFLAVAAPRLAVTRPIPALTAGRPVYADQVSAALWPCVDQVAVEHGIAQAPAVHLLGDEGFSREFLDLAFEVGRGGTLVQADRTGTAVRVVAELVPSGPPTLPWGRVERVVYDHPVGLVDVEVRRERRAGWTRLPTLSGADYNGYQYVG